MRIENEEGGDRRAQAHQEQQPAGEREREREREREAERGSARGEWCPVEITD